MSDETPVQVLSLNLQREPQVLTCPSCDTEVTTIVRFTPSYKTHLIAAVLASISGLGMAIWKFYPKTPNVESETSSREGTIGENSPTWQTTAGCSSFGTVLLPYLFKNSLAASHYCPNCKFCIGMKEPF